jgi:Icc-related predicted phosphoesterase
VHACICFIKQNIYFTTFFLKKTNFSGSVECYRIFLRRKPWISWNNLWHLKSQDLEAYLMDLTLSSDLHGHYPELPGGDLLIIAGDLTASDKAHQLLEFGEWVTRQDYKKKIVIAGNHDNLIYAGRWKMCSPVEYGWDFTYLCDSGTEMLHYPYLDPPNLDNMGIPYKRKNIKLWGSPWTKTFPDMNPKCKAFTVDTEGELAEKWALIPDDTDILITHSPAYGFGDEVTRVKNGTIYQEHVGSESLLRWIANHSKTLKIHVCGHIHEGYRVWDVRTAKAMFNDTTPSPILVNASHVNERYQPVNAPIRIEL